MVINFSETDREDNSKHSHTTAFKGTALDFIVLIFAEIEIHVMT